MMGHQGAQLQLQHRPSWRATRLSLIFMLDIVQTVRGAGHAIDPMILSVVSQSSVAGIGLDPQLERDYATAERPPPDELRRPITINAVANSAGLPFETVRRRVHRLVEAGLIEITARGVVQSEKATIAPAYMVEAQARYERLRRFYFDLKATGCLPEGLPADDAAPSLSGPPVRLANRAVGQFALRGMEEVIAVTGHPTRGLMLLQVARLSGEHLDIGLFDHDAPLGDDLRRPVRGTVLARSLRLPTETTRRHLTALVKQGALRRVPRGYLVSASGVEGPPASASAGRTAQNLRRMFVRLAEAGALDFWEQEAEQRPMRRAAGA